MKLHFWTITLKDVYEKQHIPHRINSTVKTTYLKLSLAGLYRLCGSETKKKMLRDSFEQDPDSVDLTSENVPDINVITSKFKFCQRRSYVHLCMYGHIYMVSQYTNAYSTYNRR